MLIIVTSLYPSPLFATVSKSEIIHSFLLLMTIIDFHSTIDWWHSLNAIRSELRFWQSFTVFFLKINPRQQNISRKSTNFPYKRVVGFSYGTVFGPHWMQPMKRYVIEMSKLVHLHRYPINEYETHSFFENECSSFVPWFCREGFMVCGVRFPAYPSDVL